jgi:hypothetical protein
MCLTRNTKEDPRTPVWMHWTHYRRVKDTAKLFPRIMGERRTTNNMIPSLVILAQECPHLYIC